MLVLRRASVEFEFPPDPGEMLAWVEEAYRTSLKLLIDAGVHSGTRRPGHAETR